MLSRCLFPSRPGFAAALPGLAVAASLGHGRRANNGEAKLAMHVQLAAQTGRCFLLCMPVCISLGQYVYYYARFGQFMLIRIGICHQLVLHCMSKRPPVMACDGLPPAASFCPQPRFALLACFGRHMSYLATETCMMPTKAVPGHFVSFSSLKSTIPMRCSISLFQLATLWDGTRKVQYAPPVSVSNEPAH